MEIYTRKEAEERCQIGQITLPIRYFIEVIITDDPVSNGEDYNDIIEVTEREFLNADGDISYERHTMFENGVSQICLTKM